MAYAGTLTAIVALTGRCGSRRNRHVPKLSLGRLVVSADGQWIHMWEERKR